jgi:hypothetical protein
VSVPAPNERLNQQDGLDAVTQDAIKFCAPIPPKDMPQVARRSYLGGALTALRGGGPNPYLDPVCRAAWNEGFERGRREVSA